ncbi:hypothetical protein OAF65_03320 [Verrucomicrobiales bacterium]|jgi:hypothetical protein|nr:hypothetical protein [Verrucomicrobiales bacterium]|tara:strand:- start:359 stop:658 length:300 start_codon:yes stop_codon:yes gene_type:complete
MKSLLDYTYEEFQEMSDEDQLRLYHTSSDEEIETWEEKYPEEIEEDRRLAQEANQKRIDEMMASAQKGIYKLLIPLIIIFGILLYLAFKYEWGFGTDIR